MARKLVLQDEDHVMEVEKPDGEILRLEIIRATIANQTAIEKKEKEFLKDFQEGKLTATEYYVAVMETVVKDFKLENFENFTLDQLTQISEMIQDIRGVKPRSKEQKKTAES